MTLNDLPKRPNIKITNLPVFNHYYLDEDNDGNLILKNVTKSVSTYRQLPNFDDNYLYYFYSINDNYYRYAEIEKRQHEILREKRLIRKEKLEKLMKLE